MRIALLMAVVSLFGILAVMAQEPRSRPAAVVRAANSDVVEFLPRPTDAEKQIQTALESVGDATFAEVPLNEAVTQLSADHKVNVVLDMAALRALVPAPQPELPKVSLAVQKIKLRSVLNLLCKDMGLAWVVEDEVIRITTPQVADRRMLTRTYPVGDLGPTPEDMKALKSAVEKTATASAWDVYGGEASAVTLDSSRSLIVTQTWSGQEQVVRLLRMLREAKALANQTGGP